MSLFEPMNGSSFSGASSLPFPVPPRLGESIAETVLRAAADNSYQKVGYVLSAAGISYRGNFSVVPKVQGRERDLAVTLGLQDELVRQIIPYPVPGRPGWSDFFGVPLRDAHRTMKYRRVSPRSLQESLHLKAIWSVQVVSFDPRTKEHLLDACPECARRPTYLRTHGLQFCEFCSRSDEYGSMRGRVDFRDFPQPRIEIDDMEALEFVTDLIDPERDERRGPQRRLTSELVEFPSAELFELTVATACALTSKPTWQATTLDRPSCNQDYSRFTPEVLAKSARLILDWPEGFHKVAAEVRSNAASRHGHFGVRKELGPLVALSMDAHLPAKIQQLLKHRIKLDMTSTCGAIGSVRRREHRVSSGYIPIQQASQESGLTRRTISRLVKEGQIRFVKVSDARKAPILVDRHEVGEVAASQVLGIGSQAVAVELGIPRASLGSLADRGHLVPMEHGPFSRRGSEWYLRASVEDLRRRCDMMASSEPAPGGFVRITKAVNRLGLAHANPWPCIIKQILDGKLEIWRVQGRLTALMTSLAVRDVHELAVSSIGHPIVHDIVFTQAEAADFLKTTSVRVNGLIRLGLLPSNPTAGDLRAFMTEFILTAEITQQFESRDRHLRWRDVPPLLRTSGLEPVGATHGKAGLIWRRAEVNEIVNRVFPD